MSSTKRPPEPKIVFGLCKLYRSKLKVRLNTVNVSALNTYRGSIAIIIRYSLTTIATAQRHISPYLCDPDS